MEKHKEIFNDLDKKFLKVDNFPKEYYGSNDIKAIVLGADPSLSCNQKLFKYVFGLEAGEDSSYIKGNILDNIKAIGLDIDDLYFQNLCRNYFNDVTSIIVKNYKEKWVDIVEKWVKYLKSELDNKFDKNIPILITTDFLKGKKGYNGEKGLTVLCNEEYRNQSNYKLYKNNIFCEPKNNILERKIIPFYRNKIYKLKPSLSKIRDIKNYLRRKLSDMPNDIVDIDILPARSLRHERGFLKETCEVAK